jgi:hypothetical protein
MSRPRIVHPNQRIRSQVVMTCDTCGTKTLRVYVGYCKKCGGWMRQTVKY